MSRVILRVSHKASAVLPLIAILASSSVTAFGQTTAFTYQGKLADSGTPANGNYDLEFKLFDTATVGAGAQQGSTVQRLNVKVDTGIFTVSLDFGVCASCFNGAARFLEISVRATGGGAFTTLGPRQPITSTPYALKSVNATTSDGLSVTCVNCVTSSQIGSVNGSDVTGAIPVASVPAGSGNYIQNTASPQASSNFNISGNGTAVGTLSAATVNATTQYNIGGSHILSAAGSSNLFAGGLAGPFNTGIANSFFGAKAGFNNNSGDSNSFFGSFAGFTNTTGNNNTIIGQSADVGANNLTNATAIGYRARVGQSNSLVLGSINGVNSSTADTSVGIGTTAPAARFHVIGDSSAATTPVAIFQSAGSQVPLAFRSGGSEVARIRADSQGNLVLATLNGTDKDIYFRAGDDSAGADMFIQSSTGNVGIGNTNPTDKLEVVGNIRVGTGTTGCVKDNDGTVIAGTCSSDLRLKQAITALPASLDKLVRLRPVHFYWRAKEYPSRKFGASQSFGLIAQEVEQVMPELVKEDEEGMKAVNYSKLPMLMLQAIKELKADNDSLRQDNEGLKQKVSQIGQQLEQIKQQQSQIESLKRAVCQVNANADFCR